jgi:acyl-ACP thioesterase
MSIPELVSLPDAGRVFTAQRRCRLGDVTPAGRVRLDAIARWLQDVANDDAFDASLPRAMWWVVRRTSMRVDRFPLLREALELATWCSGTGSRWAERRTRITGENGALVETASVWVHVDESTGRPSKLPAEFHDLYAMGAGGREVSARRTHPDPPMDATREPWPLRAADFDVLEHVNNAVYLCAVEEQLETAPCPLMVDVEYREGVRVGEQAAVVVDGTPAEGLRLWVLAADRVAATAFLQQR